MTPLMDKIDSVVKNARNTIEQVYGDQTENMFSGLCDSACCLIADQLRGNSTRGMNWSIKDVIYMHGELIHNKSIPSNNWDRQHTILRIDATEGPYQRTVYVDPTCGQFSDIISDIPMYYIGYKIPWWFYPDAKNPKWSTGNRIIQDVVGFFQYKVWGRISDIERKFHN